jgi:hypothetical protein
MSWRERLNNLVLLRKSQNCESCGRIFACEIGLKGCWCSSVPISDKTREYLRQNYKLCLCRRCLETIEAQNSPSSEKNV